MDENMQVAQQEPGETESRKVESQAATVRIRPANKRAAYKDAARIAELLKMAWAEQAQTTYLTRADDDKGFDHIMEMIRRGLVFVADYNGRIFGVLGCAVVQEGWSDEWFVLVRWFYVHPKFRKPAVAAGLLQAMERWADAQKEPLMIYAAIESGVRDAEKVDLLERRGYRIVGVNLIRAPQHGQQEADDGPELQQ